MLPSNILLMCGVFCYILLSAFSAFGITDPFIRLFANTTALVVFSLHVGLAGFIIVRQLDYRILLAWAFLRQQAEIELRNKAIMKKRNKKK